MWSPKITQVEMEISGLVDVLVAEGVTRFLEIGSRFGGSFWRIANALPKGSRVVSCDSGKGMGGRKPGAMQSLERTVAELCVKGYDAHLVVGHSQREATIRKVRVLGPFDAVFIDGDHELEGVTADWLNFGQHARIAAFHDIAWEKPDGYEQDKIVRVPELWTELKTKHIHREFIGGGNMGIGVLWR